jgi:hypothetical protein
MPPLARVIFGSAALAALTAAAPCDIYASGGTPCVAAHGLTRALYNSYDGPLYQVTRNLDGSTMEIYPLQARGVANAAAQDDFCTNTTSMTRPATTTSCLEVLLGLSTVRIPMVTMT